MVNELVDFENIIVAFRRKSRPCNGSEVNVPNECHIIYDFPYFGLPFGIGLHNSWRRAALRTIARLEKDNIRPNIVHAHKFTFEGIAGWYIARHFDAPLFLSVRAQADRKVFKYKPFVRPLLRKIAARAFRIYFVSAWFREAFDHYVPGTTAKQRRLPNIVRNISPVIVPKPASKGLVSAFNLDTYKIKGTKALLDGFALALKSEPELSLDIIGGGNAKSFAIIAQMIEERGLGKHVALIGRMANEALLAALPTYRAMVMPSLSETMGMSYVEALFAGIPILYTKGTALDGYLDGLDVACTVTSENHFEIAKAIITLWRECDLYRERIASCAQQLFETFDYDTAISHYCADVRDSLSSMTCPPKDPSF